ncbi:MAG: hypothetical protein MJ197_08730 [Bacteroidales bacterium]|nr:hypothetical protein [Bacteroidales bacterium]
MEGWIKIHRKFIDWEWYKDANTSRLFLHLLLIANIEDKGFKGCKVLRGQCIIGRKKLADDLNMTEQQVRTALNHLQNTQEITIKTTNKFTIVTICKYDSYQLTKVESNQQDNQQVTNNQPTSNQQVTTTKEYKNNKNIRMEEESVPQNFEEVEVFAKENNISVELAQSFYNEYMSNGWVDGFSRPIKNWKYKLRKWSQNDFINKQAKQDNGRKLFRASSQDYSKQITVIE